MEAIYDALERRYSLPTWALFHEVKDSTGFSFTRSADAVAMSLWPSRGLEIHGFEIKTFRNDWLRELKDPAKAEAVSKFCDHWWIVATKDVCKLDELPKTWGLLELNGSKLVARKPAPELKAEPMSRGFLASMLRKAAERTAAAKKNSPEAVSKAFNDGFSTGKSAVSRDMAAEKAEYDRQAKAIRVFEEASGISIDSWNLGSIGRLVSYISNSQDWHLRVADELHQKMKTEAEHLEAAIKEIKSLKAELCKVPELKKAP